MGTVLRVQQLPFPGSSSGQFLNMKTSLRGSVRACESLLASVFLSL